MVPSSSFVVVVVFLKSLFLFGVSAWVCSYIRTVYTFILATKFVLPVLFEQNITWASELIILFLYPKNGTYK